ncbi:uncharacterized protein N7511_000870 [Penicillium nucicola]|uniref:uncharacterized protein n=1 Tax=Penicillium nucicola TaxID=1850975 RepID=UPI002545794F|nr:uncharacterized protein N7511_000870 [Penicillium nucicola]KAJ5775859.1 hypothetical protein N7511_000870 [Penicillium nucicola]
MSIELCTYEVGVEDHKLATFRGVLVAAAMRCTNFQRYETRRGALDIGVGGSRVVEPTESSALLSHCQERRHISPGSLSVVFESFIKRRRSETARCSSVWIKSRVLVREPLGLKIGRDGKQDPRASSRRARGGGVPELEGSNSLLCVE